ncbi:MAG: 4Fe-4S binding protein [Pyrobaculum sp.]
MGLCGCIEYTRARPLWALSPPLVNYEKCVCCDLCTSACPFGAIRIGENVSVGA